MWVPQVSGLFPVPGEWREREPEIVDVTRRR
jgi:hypothetical protein